jgi:hypothetical protein
MLVEPREALPRTSTYRLSGSYPGRIDLTTRYQDDPSPLRTEGIYSMAGGVLTYCIAPPGRARPSAFTTTAGDGHTLAVLQRSAAARR